VIFLDSPYAFGQVKKVAMAGEARIKKSSECSRGMRFFWQILAVLVGIGFLAGSGFYLKMKHDLRSRYPELWDESPNVDGYWPAVVDLEYGIIAAGCAIVGLAILVGSAISVWRARTERLSSRITENEQ